MFNDRKQTKTTCEKSLDCSSIFRSKDLQSCISNETSSNLSQMKPSAFEIADNNVISTKHRLINKIALLNSFNLIAFNGYFFRYYRKHFKSIIGVNCSSTYSTILMIFGIFVRDWNKPLLCYMYSLVLLVTCFSRYWSRTPR